MTKEFPIFPLNSVLCPKGRLPLQIFEQRYLSMISRCLKSHEGFVIVLIKDGKEASGECTFFDVGSYARVVDFQQLPNGFLGITVEGECKVSISHAHRQSDGLYVAKVEALGLETPTETPEQYSELADLLGDLLRHPVIQALGMSVDFQDARDVGWRLVELLPLAMEDKQYLLTLDDPIYRLEQIRYLIHALAE
ncbi:peptidase S16 [Hahella sp. KA22]|uniref:LON peptidase substrate-binding domain-containing protein n=1 Tax=Hahella sp. KA22 TaxID=1628392 RepID=UPI000FDF423E|nr:LON peptidase substrate-binding domain-containing protein [Hahella sp. KA22]AZZ90525.1 peptidase S16 [Hahella sp. KA22]QAY53895.1 peptidase S16 [Hahella sp. KA22]